MNKDQFGKGKRLTVPDTVQVFNKWKKEKTFIKTDKYDFKKQPFNVGKIVSINEETWRVQKVFRTEWVEKDIDMRIEHPRPDKYWYQLSGENGEIKWMKVENIEGDNVFASDSGIIVMDHNDMVEDITSNPTKIQVIYKTDWFGDRKIEAYQYINGVRIIVLNYKKQIEMDVFEDTFEEAMQSIEENMELGVFNE